MISSWIYFFIRELLKINPFQSSVTFLYPMKTSENQRFSNVFRGYRNVTLDWNELNHVQFLKTNFVIYFELRPTSIASSPHMGKMLDTRGAPGKSLLQNFDNSLNRKCVFSTAIIFYTLFWRKQPLRVCPNNRYSQNLDNLFVNYVWRMSYIFWKLARWKLLTI